MKKYLPILISLSVLLLAVFLKSQQFPAIELVKFKVFDTYQQYFPRDYKPMGVRIIDIDDESLHKLGQWPWPRPLLGRLVQRLQTMGAAVIAFDIVFAEPDRTSPGELAKLWHDRPELQHALSLFPDHDEQFAESLAQMYSVTGFVLTHDSQDVLPQKKFGMSYAGAVGTSPLDYVRSFPTATTSLPGLVSAVDGNGF
ncbi:MAG: adenylate/guanylate cyclase domain-containing protein, partial [Rickettsiales bacterium]|nr:adenylate/guanylate cyclase domain-containing protein [Rickettsiales bacterium]